MTALEIEIINKPNGKCFQFNDTMIHAVLSGLSIVYDEVFLWSLQNHLAVWAVNGNPEFLIQTFLHHRNHLKKIKLEEGPNAEELLSNIVDGKIWKDQTPMAKLNSLEQGFQFANEQDCLGETLTPLLAKSLLKLKANPIITGSENSWRRRLNDNGEHTSQINIVQSENLFYRFCVN